MNEDLSRDRRERVTVEPKTRACNPWRRINARDVLIVILVDLVVPATVLGQTANRVVKFGPNGNLVDSSIQNAGRRVGIGTDQPMTLFHVEDLSTSKPVAVIRFGFSNLFDYDRGGGGVVPLSSLPPTRTEGTGLMVLGPRQLDRAGWQTAIRTFASVLVNDNNVDARGSLAHVSSAAEIFGAGGEVLIRELGNATVVSGGKFRLAPRNSLALDPNRAQFIAGVYAEIDGTYENTSGPGALAAVIGRDRSNSSGSSFAGYFEGRGYFGPGAGIPSGAPNSPSMDAQLTVEGQFGCSPGLSIRTSTANACEVLINLTVTDAPSQPRQNRILTASKPSSDGERRLDWTFTVLPGDTPGLAFESFERDAAGKKINHEVPLFLGWDGSVGVGTTDPQTEFAVNGDITCQALYVTLQGWPDFVFEPDHKLMPLRDVEEFVEEHKHLPGVPSANTVEKEGVDLGRMNALLLQKIEELTLHMIAQEKRIAQLEQEPGTK